ncbi:hypothetical protein D3C86_2269000 [compost metagenome]
MRLGANDADRGILFLEELGHTGDRAGRAHGTHEVRDLAAGLLPQLRARGLVV